MQYRQDIDELRDLAVLSRLLRRAPVDINHTYDYKLRQLCLGRVVCTQQ